MGVLVPSEVRRQLARPPAPAVFTEAELAGLPEVVCRHLRATIAPGTPLATSARLGMRGQLSSAAGCRSKLSRLWRPTMASIGRPGWPG
jgi:hypothetical protein